MDSLEYEPIMMWKLYNWGKEGADLGFPQFNRWNFDLGKLVFPL